MAWVETGLARDFATTLVARFLSGVALLLTRRSRPPRQVNSTFTIEPILTEGSPRSIEWKDKWTVVTADGGLAAQMEHTILITPNGAEVLTVA